MLSILKRIAAGEVLVSDGAMGTFLHAKGLTAGECPESWCITHPDAVREIAEAYLAAGADLIETNSFGGNPLRLRAEGLEEKTYEFNFAAAALARQAAGTRAYVAASVGPTSLFMKGEGGKITHEEMVDCFAQQISALAAGGADAICIETQFSLREACAAIAAAKQVCPLPVFCTFTFESKSRGFFTLTGLTPAKAAVEAAAAGADVIGANCGNGVDLMVDIARQMRTANPTTPILIHANAGQPKLVDGKTVFVETPAYTASRVPDLLAAGVNILGGCCGTGPAHIAAIAAAVRRTHSQQI